MNDLTERQRQALAFVRDRESTGFAVTVRELASALGVNVSAAHGMLRRLVAAGAIGQLRGQRRGKARGFHVDTAGHRHGLASLYEEGSLVEQKPRRIMFDLEMYWLRRGQDFFALRVGRHDLGKYGICPNDVLVVRRGIPRSEKKLLTVIIEDGRWKLAGYEYYQGYRRVSSDGSEWRVVKPNEKIFQGVPIGLMRAVLPPFEGFR